MLLSNGLFNKKLKNLLACYNRNTMASGLTPIYLIPYPLSSDPVNVHGDVQLLAEQLEDVLFLKPDKNLSNIFTQSNIFNVNSATDAVRITQSGAGNALVVEDASNPDTSAFVIDTNGNVAIGKTTASVKLDVVGAAAISGAVTGLTFNGLTLTSAATGFTIAGGTTSKTLTLSNTLTLAGTDSTTMTFPSTSQNIVGTTATQTLTNKSLSDSTTFIVDVADATKRLQFDIGGTTNITGTFATAFTTAKTVTFQDVAGTVYVSGGTDVTLADGGTNASLTAVNGGVVYSTASALAISAAGSAGQILRSAGAAAPTWSTATYPATTTANQILYSSAANTIGEITTANNQVLVTNGSGVPAFSGTLPSGVTASSLTSFGTSPTLTTPTIDTINVSGASVASALWNTTLTTGSISMGGALTTGSVNIANGTALAAGSVNIASGAGTGNKTVNIGTSATSGTTAITIGSTSGATSTVGINGATTVTGTLTTTGNVTVGGDLTVNGILTSINTNTLTVDDKNLELGGVVAEVVSTTGTVGSITGTGPWTATITGMTDTANLVVGSAITATNGVGSLGAGGTYVVASIVSQTSITYTATGGTTPVAGTITNITSGGPTNTTADGGGITLKGTTDKTITWDAANGNWTSNQPWNITSGNTFKINNVSVLSNTSVLGLTPTINATGYTLSGGTTAVAVTFAGGAAYTISGTNGQTYTLPSSGGTVALNPTTTIGDIIYASATGTPGTLTRLAGNTATQPSFLTSTGNGTANTTTSFTSSTGSGNVVLATSPTISGGSISGLTTLAIRDTSAAFDVTIAATSSPALSAGRALTLNMQNAARTISLAGNITVGGALTTASSFTTSGAFALTLTTTNTTNATIPAGTVTLVDLSTSQALTNKTISGLTVSTTTGTLTIPAATIAFSGANNTTITTTGATSVTLPTSGTLAANVTTTIGDVIYASATGTPGTLARLAGNTATQPAFLTSTGNGTANTTTSFTSSTGSGNVVLATSPSIAGGTHTGLTSLGIRDTSAAFDVTIAATSSTALTAGRTLTIDMVNAARTIKLAGNLDIAGTVTHAGAFTQTFTATANTSLTLPTSGTLAINPTTTIGDIIYASATGTPGTLTRLAGNITATKQFLVQTGNGTTSAAPAWGSIADGDLPSALTGKSYNGLTLTSTTGTFTLTNAKTFSVQNTLTLSGTDGSTLNIGAGGTLGSAAYTASTAYISSTLMTALGDMIYGGASGAATRLANAGTTNGTYVLQQTVSGGAAAAPSWLVSTGTGNNVLATSPTITTPTIDTINVSGAAIAAALWNTTLTTGSISMGGALTTGGINIATGTAFNGTVAIATGAGTVNKTINIGTSSTSGTTAITIGSSSGATSTIALNGNTTTSGNLTVGGDLTVNGTLTTVNSNTITVDDKNLELGSVPSATVSTTGTVGSITGTGPWTATITGMSSVAGLVVGSAISATNGTGSLGAGGTYIVASIVSNTSITYTATGGTTPTAGTITNITTTGATNTTANGGGITLKGATDKSIIWDSTNTNWTSSEHWNLASSKVFKINNTQVLSATAVLGITPSALATGFSIAGGTTSKTLTVSNTLTLSGTDGSTLNIGAGGTLGSAAFTASTAYEPAITTLAISKGGTGTGTAPTQWGVIYAASTTGYASTAAGTTGQVLTANTSGAPTWSNQSSLSVGTATNLSGTTVNSIPYQSASGTTSYISIGSANQVLAVNGTANGYTWVSPFTNPMTTLGDMVYGAASGTSTRLANAGTTNGVYILQETVTGGAAGAPSWLATTGSGNVVLATNPSLAGATLTAQLQSTLANNTGNGAGQIYLNGATGNRIDFNQNGVAGPSFTTRSVGTKINLWPNVGASTVDFAIGIEASNMWFSVDGASSGYKWYAGQTLISSLSGAGALTANSFVKSGGTSAQYLMADGSVTTSVIAAAGTLTGTTLASNVVFSSLTSLGTLTSLSVSGLSTLNSISVSGTATFSASPTVPSPTNNTDAVNKAYVDSVLAGGVPAIIPLDDISVYFDDTENRFLPTHQGVTQSITNPLRLLLTINGIIQYVDFPEYVWQSPLPREGFMVDSEGYLAFSEAVPAGSRFDARIMPGPATQTEGRSYSFKAVDILLGG